jgi:hypothetical protein
MGSSMFRASRTRCTANQALKARFNLVVYPNGVRMNRAFSARIMGTIRVLGRCPRLDANTAPLALRSLIKIVAFNVEDAVPTSAVILKRDLRSQLH